LCLCCATCARRANPPPSRAELRRRLAGRGTDHPDEIERRLRVAESEMQMRWRYDYCLVSGDREADFERVKAVYLAEKMRVPTRP